MDKLATFEIGGNYSVVLLFDRENLQTPYVVEVTRGIMTVMNHYVIRSNAVEAFRTAVSGMLTSV